MTHRTHDAARQPAFGPPGPGQFQYTKSESLNITDSLDRPYYYSVNYVQHRQIWIGFDGSGRIVETNTHPTFPSYRDRANWLAAGHPSLRVPPLDDKFGPHGLSDGPVNLLKLPTDPAKLAALISSRTIDGGPAWPAEDFARVGDLLRETDAPPALRSALFQVAAHIPGVTVLGTVTDPVGRSGVGVAYISRHRAGAAGKIFRSELIFDPTTSAMLAEQTVTVNSATKVSTVTSWSAYLSSGVVDSTSATLPGTPGT